MFREISFPHIIRKLELTCIWGGVYKNYAYPKILVCLFKDERAHVGEGIQPEVWVYFFDLLSLEVA